MTVSSSEDELQPVSRKRRLVVKDIATATESRCPKPKNEHESQSPTSKRRRVNTVVEGSSDTETEEAAINNKIRVSVTFLDEKSQYSELPHATPRERPDPQFLQPHENIRSLRVDRIFGCRLYPASVDAGDDDAPIDAMYLVKWEDRSYRELCWVKYDDLIQEHDAEAKLTKFHRKNEHLYLADVIDADSMSVEEAGDKKVAAVTKSRQFLESGGWRVPRVPIGVPASDQGNFLLFSRIDRIIGFRIKRRRVKGSMRALKEYLVKWSLQGYDTATWESEMVLCGRGNYQSLYGLHLDEDLRGSYQFYFDDEKLKALADSEKKAIQQYEKSNMMSQPLPKSLDITRKQASTSQMEGFEYRTSATSDQQGSTTLWQLFLEEKLDKNGIYKPSMSEDGRCRSLLAHQQEGLKWLFYNAEKTAHGSLLADEMGLGKTCQSVVYLQHILDVYRRKAGAPPPHALVVLQKSTLENWKREFSLWAPSLNVVAFCGTKSDRNAVLEWEVNYHNMKDGSVRRDVADPLRADVILVTYESIRSAEFRHLLPPKYKWTSIVVDECQKAKGGYSSVLRSTLEKLPRDNIVLLSGTPVQNSVKELFPLLSLLHPTRFSYDESKALNVEYTESSFMEAFGDIQDRDDCVELTEKLQALLRPYILRREKTQVLRALPPKLVKLIKVPLTMIQKKVYQAIYRRTAKLRVSGLQMQLRKVCIHPFMVDSIEDLILAGRFGVLKFRSKSPVLISAKPSATLESGVAPTPTTHPGSEPASSTQSPISPSSWDAVERSSIASGVTPNPPSISAPTADVEPTLSENADRELQILLQCSGKFILIDKMLRAYRRRGQKVLLFSFFKTALDLIQYYAELMDWVIERIDGDTTGEARQICIDRFNTDPDRFLFLCTTRAGGLGINLTAASVVIHLDSDYNPQHDLQAQARCHRIGQNRNVEVYHLVAEDTYENYILFDIAGRKLGLEQVLLGRLQATTGAAAVQKKKLSKHQEELALKKGVYAALRDDAKTAEEEEAFTNLSIEHILAQKTEIVCEEQDTKSEGERLPSAFSTARFEEALEDDLDRSNFWDDVQSQLDRIGDAEALDGTWTDVGRESSISHGIREARRKRFMENTKVEKDRAENDSDSSVTDSDLDESDQAGGDDADFQVTQNPSKTQAAQQPLESTAVNAPSTASTEAPSKATRKSAGSRSSIAKREGAIVVSSQSSDTTTQEDGAHSTGGGRASVARKRRSRVGIEGVGPAQSSPHVVSKVDEQILAAAIRLTATITQPPQEAVSRVSEYLERLQLNHFSQVWRKNVEDRDARSPLAASEDLPLHARIYDLVYRCLCGIEAWTKTPFGAANGIKSEHLRWIDQFSPWGVLSMHEATLRVLDASCNPDLDVSELKRPVYDVSQVTQTFLKEFLGALTSWEASCAAWRTGQAKFKELMTQEYIRKAEEVSSLPDGGRQWYDHGSTTEEMVLTVLKPIVCDIFGDQIGHREGGSRRQTWIPAEDVVAKFIFLHLSIGADLKPLLNWPPPGDEVDWSVVSQVVGKVSRLADGPERRRDAVLNRYYNRLDSRWNDEPFTEEERHHLVTGFHSKAQPATIARQLTQRNLEKVKKGLRCIQLQVAAGEKKRKLVPDHVQTSPSQPRISILPPELEDVHIVNPLPTPVVVSSTAPIVLDEEEGGGKEPTENAYVMGEPDDVSARSSIDCVQASSATIDPRRWASGLSAELTNTSTVEFSLTGAKLSGDSSVSSDYVAAAAGPPTHPMTASINVE